LIGYAFLLLATDLAVQSLIVLAVRITPHPSPLGIAWTGVTAMVMFALAAGKARVGSALGNPVIQTEAKVTLVDRLLATAVLCGLVLHAWLGWWWADPLAAFVLVYYAIRESRTTFTHRGPRSAVTMRAPT
jgi:divalent metal cation (Fe/Co/Zn/Cd) transporter